MEHTDIIAIVYPHGTGDVGKKAVKANTRCMPARLAQPSRTRRKGRDRRERESTEPLQNPGASPLDYLPSLAIRFNDVPRTDKGLIFGSNPNCDVVVDTEGISNVHFSLTFDEYNRPIIQDLNSLRGTQVTYDEQGEGVRRDFRWIVGGHEIPQKKDSIIITVPAAVSFQIVTQAHNIASPEYVNGVNRFRRGTATTEDLLQVLGLSQPSTRGSQTPGTGDISLRKKLGEGSFGIVTHLWNVSTGEERVVKTPSPRAIRNGQVDHRAWEREAYIMGLVSHERIVRLIESFPTPQPELHLEYMPYGSLDDQKDISYDETSMIVHQCSSALAYLHGLETPIAHRDIKPANILVENRSQDGISVKLGDFGLSRHSAELMTFCGTYRYLAPEVYSDMRTHSGYTAVVDIWSLGVVACQLVYGLPRYKDEYRQNGVAWCKKIVKKLQQKVGRQPTALGSILTECMVVLSPESRYSASDCYDALESLLGTENGSSHGLVSSHTSYSGEEAQTTFRYALQNDDAEDLSTVIYQPRRSAGAVATSSFVRSAAPPPASPVLLTVASRQYEEVEETSSSAIRRYNNWQGGHEMSHFLQEYSADPLNSLFVGSSLASQLGGNDSEEWASQFLQGSSQQDQVSAGVPETGRASEASRASLESRIPRGGSGEQRPVASGPGPVEQGNAVDADDYDEMAHAALMLQVIGQGGQWSGFEVGAEGYST